MALRFESLARELYHCADCNYCVDAVWAERGLQHVCPTLSHHSPLTSYSGRGYIAAARAWREGVELDLPGLAARAFTCSTCGHCETVCPIGLHPTEVNRALRGALWEAGAAPAPVRALLDQIHRTGAPCSAPPQRELAGPDPQGLEARVYYLPGCAAAGAVPAEAEAAIALIRASGQAVAALPQDHCCGAPQVELGLAAEGARMVDDLARRAGAGATVLLSGLECARQWHTLADTGVRALSLLRFIADALGDGRLRLTLRPATEFPAGGIFLQDSCQTRMAPGEASALREICASLGLTVQSERAAQHVLCCGAGGGMPAMEPAAAARMAEARITAAPAAVHLVADPRCLAHLAQANPQIRFFGPCEFLRHFFQVEP